MQDPYRVLGIEPSATDDEIKKAYRELAKKYHPDVNNGSAAAEARMKEVNEAYSAVMKMRREGTTSGYGSGSSSGYYGGYGSGGSSGYYGGYQSGYRADPQMQAVRNYIQAGHYQEALHMLENMAERTAEWYYLSGEANYGLGNRIAALNDAQRAVAMDPNSLEYRLLLSRLQGRAGYYRSSGQARGYNMPNVVCGSPLLSCCLINMLCNCLCNCCGGGYGGWR